MEDFPAEHLYEIISIQIHTQQYGYDLKWIGGLTLCVFTKCLELLDKESFSQ